ncbi:unnamed protein product [Phytomonas sp. Hart1]|nr:unnamed protein product [Phytomonas sp. Hart1]|eukprot:CCW72055.1 unnamed protein product [Phytomonas sp. isolate Hart1]
MQTCAVIGCGAAGMTATATLRQHGLLVTCFDLASAPGGVWQSSSHDAFSSRGLISPIYPTMRCPLPKDLMAFSDLRFDYRVAQFPHHGAVRHYLGRCAEARGVHGLTRFNTKVESARLDARDGLWKLLTVNVVSGDVLEFAFDRVCVCTGRTHAAAYPGDLRRRLAAYTRAGGELFHAAHLKDFRALRRKRVVVVGDGLTAYDYGLALKRFGAEVYHSTLLGPAAAEEGVWGGFWRPREPPRGGAIRDAATLLSLALLRLPAWRGDVHKANALLQRWMRYRNHHIEAIPRVGAVLGAEDRGLLFAPDPTARVPQGELLDEAARHHLGRRPGTSLTEQGVFIDHIDVVVSATGYHLRFPFLHPTLRRELEGDPSRLLPGPNPAPPDAHFDRRGLYLGTISTAHPSLAFVGTQNGLLPPFLMFEIQSRFIAHAFTRRLTLPASPADRIADEARLLAQNPLLADLYNPQGLGLHSAVYFNVLQQQMGVASKETYTSKVFDRYRWFLISSALGVYHKFRAMAPLKRKKQHLLFSNAI